MKTRKNSIAAIVADPKPHSVEGQTLPVTKTLPIAGLDIGTCKVRDVNRQVVQTYKDNMERGDVFPPVAVYDVGGTLYLVDGWHRVEACGELHRDVEVSVYGGKALEDAKWAALGANRTNAYQLSAQDAQSGQNEHLFRTNLNSDSISI